MMSNTRAPGGEMSRLRIRRLVVSGPGKPEAAIEFGRGLTLITGLSETGKSHILECIDYALGAGSRPREIPEHRGYTDVALDLEVDDARHTIHRSLLVDDLARIVSEGSSESDPEAGTLVKVHIADAADPADTLSGWLLQQSEFDLAAPVISNRKGKAQRLSFRTVAPLAVIKEDDVISAASPLQSGPATSHTASRSIFQILLTGVAPSPAEVAAIKGANDRKQEALQRIAVLDRLIRDLREEIASASLDRRHLEAESERIEQELASVSETVSESGSRVRALLRERNQSLAEADRARRAAIEADELQSRFELLAQHYKADIQRLEFVLEGGHFFQQLAASYCQTCGRPVERDDDCHPESADFEKVERAARVEIGKLATRLTDLDQAIADAESDGGAARARLTQRQGQANHFDEEIKEVANPSAKAARARVQAIAKRRRAVEDQLLLFRELDRYVAAREEADVVATRSVEHYRREQDLPSLRAFSTNVNGLLVDWKFPLTTGVYFDRESDDVVVDGKPRRTFGKGARAVTHMAFTVGLMHHCIAAGTPHPGVVIVDTPLTPFRGIKDGEDDPTLTRDVHTACLFSLASQESGQVVVIENVEPPGDLRKRATVHEFVGGDGDGREGFYPRDPVAGSKGGNE